MGIQREFLGWRRPALVSATEFLHRRYARERVWDLANVIVVTPGARAGRRLLEMLVAEAEAKKLLLTPPQTVTEGKLPELLYELKRPLASVVVQQLTWLQALKKMSLSSLRPLVPHPPAADDPLRWLELAELFRKQHAEFAADGIDFNEVLRRATRWEGFTETDRWKTLAKLQRSYLDQLDALQLWDAQTARLVAIEKKEPQTDCDVILLGMVDMNTTLRKMLDFVSPQVTALIVAPESEGAHFDDHGCLIPESWQQLPLPIGEQQLQRVDGPAEQAGAVVDWLRELNGQYAAEEVIVGVADESLVPHLQREIAQQGLHSRWVEGKKVAESAPYKLLDVAAKYADRRRFADLAACVRHPDIYDWLQKQSNFDRTVKDILLTTLDLHYEKRLSSWLDAADLADHDERDSIAPRMIALVRTLETLFKNWPTTPQPIGIWMQHARLLLKTIYGELIVDKFESQGRYLLKCLEEVQQSLLDLAELPPSLQPTLTLVDAIELALEPLEDTAIAPPTDFSAVEMLGWLELPLDDAPALIVTTVNEGFIPKSSRVDAFLPDNLRRELGLNHDGRRYARDAYALQVLAHSRKELRLISARRDTNKDPLAPSRLLFTGEPAVVAQRALRWFSAPPETPPRPNLLLPRGKIPAQTKLPIPQPMPQDWTERINQILQKITVTQFKAYLACPYRFYLGYVLQLEARSDQAAEMDALAFGNLLHEVLEEFGREKINTSADTRKLRKYFDDRLDAVAASRCKPRHARAAVRVQVEQARQRLHAFAEWQANRTAAGWRIVYTEEIGTQLLHEWDVDGMPIYLKGRIDRIDYHPRERTLSILDYKTGDTAKRPEQVHRSRGEWVDLQLPLYRHLYQAIENLPIGDVREGGIELGYITLPKDPGGAGDRIAGWSALELAAADEKAREVIRNLRAGVFWPPNPDPPAYEDEFTAICQDNALGRNAATALTIVEESP